MGENKLNINGHPEQLNFDPEKLNFKTFKIKKNQFLFLEGSQPGGLYYIKNGKVKLFKMGIDGKEKILKIAKEGSFIGYTDLINNTEYTRSAKTMEETTLYFIAKDDFDDMLNSKDIMFYFFKLASVDLANTEEDLVNMAYKPVRGRLIEALLEHNDGNENDILTVNLSREDLASIIGSATETVIRLLSDFKRDNLISIKGRMISVLDNNRLSYFKNIYN